MKIYFFDDEKKIFSLFRISLFVKGAFAVVEIIGGVLAYFVTQHFLYRVVLYITQQELLEDPRDFFSNYLVQFAGQFSLSSQHFVVLYLLSHGIIKLFLIQGLIKKNLWYYPASLVIFSLFILYQFYRWNITYSPWLLALTLFDIGIIVLTVHEYRYIKKSQEKLSV